MAAPDFRKVLRDWLMGFYLWVISLFRRFPRDELSGVRQHALQRVEVHRVVFGDGLVDFFGERLGIVDGRLDLRLRPAEIFGHGGGVSLIGAEEQHELPHGEGAGPDACLAASRGIAKVDESELRAAQALPGQVRADGRRMIRSHESILTSPFFVSIVAPAAWR